MVFGPNTDSKLIHAALQDMGLSPAQQGNVIYFSTGWYNTKTCEFKFSGQLGAQHSQEIKRAYSAAVVKAQAKRFNWLVKADAKDKYKMQVTKRSI